MLHNVKIPMLITPGERLHTEARFWSPTKIVITTDFSNNARAAMDLGFEFARVVKSSVKLISVPELRYMVNQQVIDRHLDESKKQLEELAGLQKYGRVETAALAGQAHENICHYAASQEADIVFMGLQGQRIIGNLLIGSTVDRVIRSGRVPILAVSR